MIADDDPEDGYDESDPASERFDLLERWVGQLEGDPSQIGEDPPGRFQYRARAALALLEALARLRTPPAPPDDFASLRDRLADLGAS